MANKIAVEGSRDYLKKSVAQLLVRRQIAEWVIPGSMIRRLGKKAFMVDIRTVRSPMSDTRYIPETMPPYELHNLKFKETDSMRVNRMNCQVDRYVWLGRNKVEAFA